MTSHRHPDGTFFAFDSTMLKDAQKCFRYFQYKHIEGWQPFRKSVHLLFGGHYATALEHFHKHVANGLSRDDALIEVVWETLKSTWEVVGTKDGEPIGKPWDSMDNAKTRDTLVRSIIWYVDTFEDEHTKTVILANGDAAVEYSFKLEIDDGFLICGHIDRLCEISGDIYVMDQKTTGSTITPRFFEQFSPDTQMSLYTFAGKAIFDIPVKGVVIDGAQIAVGFTRFERGFSFRTDGQLEEWYDDALELMHRINTAVTEARFPMNPASCGNYGGCEFRHVCSKSPEVRNLFLKADFKPGWVWNPLIPRL